jgi:hypothetical protein
MTSFSGTFDWKPVEFLFTASARDYPLTLQARLGISGGIVSGTVWFDDIRIEEIQ